MVTITTIRIMENVHPVAMLAITAATIKVTPIKIRIPVARAIATTVVVAIIMADVKARPLSNNNHRTNTITAAGAV